jgi:ATP-dependent RNA helicase RhlE
MYKSARYSNRNNSRTGFSSRPSYQRNRFQQPAKRRNFGAYIPKEKYIRKAVTPVETTKTNEQTTTFAQMELSSNLQKNIFGRGYEVPMPIQSAVISHVIQGKDVVGIANTGTGKTGAFLIPILERFQKREIKRAIVIVPTRELALQIFDEFKYLARGLGVFASVCIGGASMSYQIRDLRRYPKLVIGTPGRIQDLMDRGDLKLDDFDCVVLDEVDRMVDMGFIQSITYILSKMSEKRQSMFFSATVTDTVKKTIGKFSKDPIIASVKTRDTSEFVEQDIVSIKHGENKIEKLVRLLEKEEVEKVIIFGRTKHGVERLAQELHRHEFKIESIHGDKPQNKRKQAIRLFREGIVNILVATDVAARGIDIDGITHVINFDEPATYDDYTHRIGRTGRAGKKGFALTFVNEASR